MMTEPTDKTRAVTTVVASIEKQFGRGAIMALGAEPPEDIKVIRTGSLALDEALGVGGYPRGRIVELFGPESSGKTTLALHAIAEAQRAGGVPAILDAEHALDIAYAKSIGVDPERLLISQPDNGEQALDIAEMLTRSGAVDLIVVDSVAALTPKAEIEGEMGFEHAGLQARLMSQALRKLTGIAHRTDTLLIFVNQLRQRVGVTFGNPETTTGGNALKFYASLRLDVRRLGTVKLGEETVGARTRVRVLKNKCAVPFKEAEFDIRFGHGIDAAGDLLDSAITRGIIEKSGSRYEYGCVTFAEGRDSARAALDHTPLGDQVRAELEGRAPDTTR